MTARRLPCFPQGAGEGRFEFFRGNQNRALPGREIEYPERGSSVFSGTRALQVTKPALIGKPCNAGSQTPTKARLTIDTVDGELARGRIGRGFRGLLGK